MEVHYEKINNNHGIDFGVARKLGICLLLVHHLRKMNDRDPVNKLSGSTGISGAVDAIFVLDKNERIERLATFYASGRDIRDRKIQLELDKDTCVWTLISDSLTVSETMLPDEMACIYGFAMRSARRENKNKRMYSYEPTTNYKTIFNNFNMLGTCVNAHYVRYAVHHSVQDGSWSYQRF